MQVWEKQLVPTGRRGEGSSDRDWKTLGMSFSLPQPSWCFLKLVKGAQGIQGIAQKEAKCQWDSFRQAREMQVNNEVIQSPKHPGQLGETASCECFPLSSPPSGPGEAHILPAPSTVVMERHQDKGSVAKLLSALPEPAVFNASAHKGLEFAG